MKFSDVVNLCRESFDGLLVSFWVCIMLIAMIFSAFVYEEESRSDCDYCWIAGCVAAGKSERSCMGDLF